VKYFDRKRVLKYLYDQLTGNFAGFLVGMSATGLVSRFFETRSIKNLWGLTARKAVVSKETFGALEWMISIVIGFIVFEIMTKVVKQKLDQKLPALKTKLFRWVIGNNLRGRAGNLYELMDNRRMILFGSFNNTLRKTFSRHSRN
jgi:hypothetical protein